MSSAPRRGTRRGVRAGAAAASESATPQPSGTSPQISTSVETAIPADPSISSSEPPSSTDRVARAPATSARGAASASSSRAKFKPKANRRTEEERQRIADEQLKIQNKKAADDARRARGRGRGRGRARGRGGFREFETGRGGGMFGPAGSASRGGGLGGGGGGFGGEGFGSRSGGPSGTGSAYNFADGRVEDDRINADELRGNQHNDDDYASTDTKFTSTKKKRAILPVGIKREEVQEGGVELTTAEDIAAGEKAAEGQADGSDSESMFVDGPGHKAEPGLKNDDEVWDHVAPKTREKIMVKNEQGELVEASAIDTILEAKEQDRKKSLLKKNKDPEEEQIADDMARLAHLLTIGDQDQTPDANGRVPANPLEGALFLFQLPPVLPPLKITRQPIPRAANDHKGDYVKPEPTDDVVMLDQPAANIDLTGASETPDRRVKGEDDSEVEEEREPEGDKELPYPPEGGYVGKLVVRRSGKVELDWGGQTLEMVPGIDTNFLTTAALIEETNPMARSNEFAGTAYSMGKIHGKFVLAPKWGEEEDWVVDPGELEVNDEMLQ